LVKALCGKLFDSRGFLGDGCLLIENGLIVDIKKTVNENIKRYDFRNELIIMPAFIDIHVHLRGLKLSYKEDEFTGTRAALQSGILLVLDMPNTLPRLDRPEALRLKIQSLEEKAVTDYGVYAAIPKDLETLVKLSEEPIAGFKIYPEDLRNRLETVKALKSQKGKVIVVHPEVPEVNNIVIEDNLSRGLHRGCHLETLAVDYVKELLNGSRIHITHASCPSTVIESKRAGFTVDVTPHHIFYNSKNEGCLWKVNPPLRSEEIRFSLMKLLIDTDLIDALVSDHAPHALSEKVDPLSCMPGFAWLEAWPWLVFRLVHLGIISLEKFLRLLTVGPARILGLDRKYGLLERGYRANIIVVDPNYSWRFSGPHGSKDKHLHIFMKELQGRVRYAFLGGELVLEDGECFCNQASKQKINAFRSLSLSHAK
jgi:dihydroorotase